MVESSFKDKVVKEDVLMKVFKFLYSLIDRKATVKKLREWGAKIGQDVELYNVTISRKDATCLEIGNHVTLTGCHILTHDASTKRFLGNDINRIGRVVIGNNVFVGVHSLILPNVKIGDNCIVAAGSIVTKDVPAGSVVGGGPAKVLCSIQDFIDKHKANMKDSNTFWNVKRDQMTKEELDSFNRDINGRIVYLGKK